jgi:hypothetical protein
MTDNHSLSLLNTSIVITYKGMGGGSRSHILVVCKSADNKHI